MIHFQKSLKKWHELHLPHLQDFRISSWSLLWWFLKKHLRMSSVEQNLLLWTWTLFLSILKNVFKCLFYHKDNTYNLCRGISSWTLLWWFLRNICECLQWSKTYNCEHAHFSCASWKTFSSVSFTTKATFITSVGENGAHGSNGIIKTSTWKWRRPVNNLKEKKQTNCISFFIVNASLRWVIFLFLAFTVIW